MQHQLVAALRYAAALGGLAVLAAACSANIDTSSPQFQTAAKACGVSLPLGGRP